MASSKTNNPYTISQGDPASLAVGVPEAKLRLRIDHDDEDPDVEALVKAAIDQFEADTNLALINRTVTMGFDAWPAAGEPIELLPAPLSSVASVKYYDESETLQTLATSNYVVDTASNRGLIWLAKDKTWPTLGQTPRPIQIAFTAGYGATQKYVPDRCKQAILLLVGHWYANREAVVTGTIATELPMAYQSLVDSARVPSWV